MVAPPQRCRLHTALSQRLSAAMLLLRILCATDLGRSIAADADQNVHQFRRFLRAGAKSNEFGACPIRMGRERW